MRVGVRHHLSTRLQIQDTHWEVGEKQAIDSGRVVSPLLPPVYNSLSFEHFTNQQSARQHCTRLTIWKVLFMW